MPPELGHVAVQQEQQAARLSTLEAEVRHVIEAVSQVTAALESGFRDTREMIEQAQQRNDRRTSTIHERLDKQVLREAEQSRWNPGLTLAAITCAMLIGGVFVAFVHMTTTPVKENISRIVTRIDASTERDCDDAATISAFAVRISDLERRIGGHEAQQVWQQRFDARLRSLERYGLSRSEQK